MLVNGDTYAVATWSDRAGYYDAQGRLIPPRSQFWVYDSPPPRALWRLTMDAKNGYYFIESVTP